MERGRRKHSWKPRHGFVRCLFCGLQRKANPDAASRPLYSKDNGERWETTEYGYVPWCEERR